MKRQLGSGCRGVSLIEALVALAVMAFGILGVVGVQATLRSNADLSRQRAEAVRIADQAIENWRAFTTLTTTPGQTAYQDISTQAAVDIVNPLYNTTFSLVRTVVATDVGNAKTLLVTVSWNDRAGVTQQVALSSVIAGISPELPGSLLMPGDASPEQQAMGRNAAIPVSAIDQGTGYSNFAPPGSASLTWVFNNITGLITTICNPSCTAANSFLVSGYLDFALGGPPLASVPSSSPLLNPDGSSAMSVVVNVTSPAIPQVSCFQQVVTGIPGYVSYFCAIPVPVPPASQRWSGQSVLQLSTNLAPSIISSSLADATPGNFKICRYTTELDDTPVNNTDHPLTYSSVAGPLANQNFLVVSAPYVTAVSGSGSCPVDGSPSVITYRHQPLS